MAIEKYLKILGRNIKEIRIKNGLSLTQLAKRTNIDRGILSGIERGEGNPLIGTLLKLSLTFKKSLYLLSKEI